MIDITALDNTATDTATGGVIIKKCTLISM